jgi:lipopolysaccharide export system permease protein
MLISSIKVLCALNASKELVALQAAGLKLKLLLRPFLILAAACSLFNYIAEESILPSSLNFLDKFDQKTHSSSDKKRKQPFHVLHLQDQSKLIYQKHDLKSGCYVDVYWIRSFNDIWKIKKLKADPKNPVAEFVDHLVRSKDGLLTKTESFEKSYMKGLTWQKDLNRKGTTRRRTARSPICIKCSSPQKVFLKTIARSNPILPIRRYRHCLPCSW